MARPAHLRRAGLHAGARLTGGAAFSSGPTRGARRLPWPRGGGGGGGGEQCSPPGAAGEADGSAAAAAVAAGEGGRGRGGRARGCARRYCVRGSAARAAAGAVLRQAGPPRAHARSPSAPRLRFPRRPARSPAAPQPSWQALRSARPAIAALPPRPALNAAGRGGPGGGGRGAADGGRARLLKGPRRGRSIGSLKQTSTAAPTRSNPTLDTGMPHHRVIPSDPSTGEDLVSSSHLERKYLVPLFCAARAPTNLGADSTQQGPDYREIN